MIWGRAAARCSFPGCAKELVHDATDTDDESLVGEVTHIVAEKPDGPRGTSPLTLEEREKYANLILLCRIHHKIVDDQFNEYTVEKLTEFRRTHEATVRSRLGPADIKRLEANEIYAAIVDEWATRVDLANWEKWTSWLLTAEGPSMGVQFAENLHATVEWILSRLWPRQCVDLEGAFHNFRYVLNDMLMLFHDHAEKHGDWYYTTRFYRIGEWNPERYKELSERYEHHVDLVDDLVLELTRAANFVCDMVRARLDPQFRAREGVLLVTSGPYEDLKYRTRRAEYQDGERGERPYPGLRQFEIVRFSRDYSFAEKPDNSRPGDGR